MQPTTANYDPYADERYVYAQAVYELISTTAADAASVSVSSNLAISKPEQTHDKLVSMTHALVSGEPNQWKLNGRMKTPNITDNGSVGWWSGNASDTNGDITETLTATFAQPQSSKGFTLVFDDKADEYITDFNLSTYDNADAVINTIHVTDNTESVRVVNLQSDNYYKVVFTANKTSSPQRYVRVCELVFGFLKYFNAQDIQSIVITHEIDPSMQALPSAAAEITINNVNHDYNILNPTGIYAYLQKGQGLNTVLRIGNEDINIGRYYFETSKSSNGALTATIMAYDRVMALDKTKCNIGMTGTWTIAAAVAAVITDSGLSITTDIPVDIGSRAINKCIPLNTTHREALRLIAQAGKSVCYFSREDKLIFFDPVISTAVDALDADKILTFPEVTDNGLINTVEITVRDDFADTETVYSANNVQADEEVRTLAIDNPLVTGNDVATWLLGVVGMRYEYSVSDRGNPAREIGDSISILDAYGSNATGILTQQTLIYNGGLESEIRTVTDNA